MKLALLFLASSMLCCTKQQAQSVDSIAVDLTNAVCAPLEGQPAGQPYIDIVCTIAQGVETTAGGVISNLPAKTVQIRLPASEGPAFLADHKGR